jgi:hypothetical protein
MNSSENKTPLNDNLLSKLKVSIFIQEKNNVKTKAKSDLAMVDTIRKIIQTEVDKNDNQAN